MAIATFGSKMFSVSRNKIYTPDDISFSQELDIETQAVEGKKPATYIKGIGLIPLSFKLRLDARFVIVSNEIDWWNKTLVAKVPQVFTLGGKTISKNKFLLKSVEVDNLIVGKGGAYLKADLNLQFEEYVSPGYKKASTSSGGKSSGGKGKLNLSAEAMKIIEKNKKKK